MCLIVVNVDASDEVFLKLVFDISSFFSSLVLVSGSELISAATIRIRLLDVSKILI